MNRGPFSPPVAFPDLSRRVVQPEILDSLPEDDPAAIANRRDIRRLNALMGNFRWFEHRLRERFPQGGRFLELGAGDGALGCFLEQRLEGVRIDGLDLWRRPLNWPPAWGWIEEDLTKFEDYDRYDGILCNLILHQFEDELLRQLGTLAGRKGGTILVAEPGRKRLPHLATRLLFPLLSPVSRHDALVSIQAGFRLGELPELLGIEPDRAIESYGRFGTYRMVAEWLGEGKKVAGELAGSR